MYDGLVHIQKDFANMLTLHKKPPSHKRGHWKLN